MVQNSETFVLSGPSNFSFVDSPLTTLFFKYQICIHHSVVRRNSSAYDFETGQ